MGIPLRLLPAVAQYTARHRPSTSVGGALLPTDRIIQPEAIAEIIRGWLAGDLDGADAALRAIRLAGSTDRILAGHRTREVNEAYWALRRLAESAPPDRQTMQELLEWVEGRRRPAQMRAP